MRKKSIITAFITVLFMTMIFSVQVNAAAQTTYPIPIDADHFPDENFREYVGKYFDKLEWNANQKRYFRDGYLSLEEVKNVTYIEVYGDNITDLTGIQYFKNLNQLQCGSNRLTSLDVSGLKKLTYLYCNDNQLTELKVGGTALKTIECRRNKLENLNFNKGVTLVTLMCDDNKLKTLKLTGCNALKTLWCENNRLSSLDLSGRAKLETLYCQENSWIENGASKAMENLNLSGCTSLRNLNTSENNIQSLNLTSCKSLEDLSCRFNPIRTLNLSACDKLEYLDCAFTGLSTLNIKHAKNLWYLDCSYNGIKTLDVSGLSKLEGLHCTNNDMETLILDGCTALEVLGCDDNKLSVLDLTTNKILSDTLEEESEAGEQLKVTYDEGTPIKKYVEPVAADPASNGSYTVAGTTPGTPGAYGARHIEVPNWIVSGGNIVAVDGNGKVIRYTGVVTWRGYYVLIANGVLYKKATFFQDKVDRQWKYFQNGVLARTGNTFINGFGKLWHVNNGVLDTSDCFVNYNGKFVYSYHGMAATMYTGWIQYDQYKCYLVKGVLTKITR